MKDTIYESFGFGCHCRNCHFVKEYNIGKDEPMRMCRNSALRPEQMNNKSFCSAGIPKYIPLDTTKKGN